MSDLLPLLLGDDNSRQLQSRIQVELARRQWSEGDDDEVMAEYILVMLANNKTQSQIAGELEDLVGDGSGDSGGIGAFVDWLWQERLRSSDSDNKMEVQGEATSSEPRKLSENGRRRSLSPTHRAPRSTDIVKQQDAPYGRHYDRRTEDSDRWTNGNRRGEVRGHNQRMQQNDSRRRSPRRELLPSSRDARVRRGSDEQHPVRNGGRELLSGSHGISQMRNHAAMDDPRLQTSPKEGQRTVNIFGQGNESIFKRSIGQLDQQMPSASLFSRVAMPDPRAPEFVPSIQQQTDLLSRLDPMVPNNPLPSSISASAGEAGGSSHAQSFPSQPQNSALCRYSLKCTNPLCIFSHPSVSAVAKSRQTGNEPLVLKQESCRFQYTCTNADCSFSHISPAVAFVRGKVEKMGDIVAAPINIGSNACHFQMDCKNPKCTYAHFDPSTGQVVTKPVVNSIGNGGGSSNDISSDSTAAKLDQALESGGKPCRYGVDCTRPSCHFFHPPERSLHISHRLARFGCSDVDGEIEAIIPAA